MRNLLEEREDDLANSIKELHEKCQEAQRLKVMQLIDLRSFSWKLKFKVTF